MYMRVKRIHRHDSQAARRQAGAKLAANESCATCD
jgi:hypothetical protein